MDTTQSDPRPSDLPAEWELDRAAPMPLTATPAAPLEKRTNKVAIAVAAALLVVGGWAAYAFGHSAGSSTAAVGQTGQAAGAPAGGQAPGQGGGQGGAGGLGFQPTQYHVDGTITAIGGSTVTLQTSSGTKTYAVTASTHLMRGGSTAALTAFKVGDTVNASTTTNGGTVLNDMVAGMNAAGAQGGTPPPGTSATTQGTTGTSGTTT